MSLVYLIFSVNLPEVVVSMSTLKMLTHLGSEYPHGTHHAVNCLFHCDRCLVVGVTCPGVHLTILAIIGARGIWISLRQFVTPDVIEKICIGLKLSIALETVGR